MKSFFIRPLGYAIIATMIIVGGTSVVAAQMQPAGETHHADVQQPSSTAGMPALTDDQYAQLGEQMMTQMMGYQHEPMDNVIEEKAGKDIMRQMHIVMGKRIPMMAQEGMMSGVMMNMMKSNGRAMMGVTGMMNNSDDRYVTGRERMKGRMELGEHYDAIGVPFKFTWWVWMLGHLIFCLAFVTLVVLANIRLWQLIRKK